MLQFFVKKTCREALFVSWEVSRGVVLRVLMSAQIKKLLSVAGLDEGAA